MADLYEDWKTHYSDMSFDDFTSRIHAKFYPDMPEEQFKQKVSDAVGASPLMQQNTKAVADIAADPFAYAHQQDVSKQADNLMKGHEGAGSAGAMGVARGATLGLSERGLAALAAVPAAAASWWHGGSFDPEAAYELNRDALMEVRDRQREAHPVASTAGEIAGGLAAPIPVIGGPATTALGGVARGVGEGAIAGGVYGGAQAAPGDVTSGAIQGAVTGGVIGAPLGAVTGAIGGRMARNALRAEVPAMDASRQAARAAYNEADQLGAVFRPQSFTGRFAPDVRHTVDDFLGPGLTLDNSGNTFADVRGVLSDMNEAGQRPVTLNQLDNFRQRLRAINMADEGQQGALAGRLIDRLDHYVDTTGAGDIIGNPQNAQGAIDALGRGRETWAGIRRGQRIQDAIDYAQTVAEKGSGDPRTALKNRLAPLLRAPGYSAEERAAIREAIRTGNTSRLFGGLGAIGAGMSIGTFLGGPLGAAAGGIVGNEVSRMVNAATKATSTNQAMNAAEYAAALSRIPRSQRAAIAGRLAAQRRISPDAARRMIEGAVTPQAVEVVNE
jgi:hypothetical protein